MTEKGLSPRQLILDFPTHPAFTFSNFVVSDGSRFAFDAARRICSSQPTGYHSLYLYGDKNLGKTHLLMSIGNHVAEHLPGQKVLYIHGPDFFRKVGEGDPLEIHETVTRLLDVDFFLLDDVDGICGKPAAQEKLYHIYNTLAEKEKKAVFTGHARPENLTGTEGYLKSRLQWGMTAEILPIDDATTAKIITKLGKDVGLAIPEKIIDYLLTRIPRDFLSIKNTVVKLNRESYVQKKKVTLSLAKAALNLP
ncbi:MAG: DnaA ATPase domain-containing protein [Nitrospinaceae bacterium]